MRDLRRGGLWGLAAAGALTVAVYAGTTTTGRDRLVSAIGQTRQMVSLSDDKGLGALDAQEGQRLAETVRTLTADRDRLQIHIAALERSLGDITASVARVEKAAQLTAQSPPQAAPATGPVTQASDDITASIQSPATPTAQAAPAKAEFGLDLGAANTLDGLRVLWATARQRHGALLEGLRPVVHVRERPRSGSIETRLVAGPVANAVTAARMCATLVAAGAICQPSAYDGQRLAIR
jgi:hypothetical protein